MGEIPTFRANLPPPSGEEHVICIIPPTKLVLSSLNEFGRGNGVVDASQEYKYFMTGPGAFPRQLFMKKLQVA
jgi:hypothetical protein